MNDVKQEWTPKQVWDLKRRIGRMRKRLDEVVPTVVADLAIERVRAVAYGESYQKAVDILDRLDREPTLPPDPGAEYDI